MQNADLQPNILESAFQRRIGAIFTINMKLLGSGLAAAVAWLMWPSSIQDWGFGFIAIMLWLATIAGLIDAAKAAYRLYARERVLMEFERIGGRPKGSALANEDDLDKAGML